MKLRWNGEAVVSEVTERMARAMAEIGLRVETESKRELRKGHGVLTGTLRRSIHSAPVGYNWQADDVMPSVGTPERGGDVVTPKLQNKQMVVEVGSGLRYAMAVHQGHHRFGGYHYLTTGVERVRSQVVAIVRRHAK